MMLYCTNNLGEFVISLRRKGVRLWKENGNLRYMAPRGVLSTAELTTLHGMKAELLRLIESLSEHALSPRSSSAPAPLTYVQEARWRDFQVLGMARNSRNCTGVTRLCGPLSIEAVSKAVDAITLRHEALRTRIVPVDGLPMQIVEHPPTQKLEVVDLRRIPKVVAERTAQRLVEDTVNEPTDMAVGPLFRAQLIQVGEHDSILVLAVDHIVADGTSMNLLRREIFTSYLQRAAGSLTTLPEVRVQLADYAAWQRKTEPIWLKTHGDYWRDRLSGAPRINLPLEEVPTGTARCNWIEAPVRFEPPLRDAFKDVSRLEKTSLAMIVFATYIALLMRWCNVDEVIVGIVTNGRAHCEVQHTVGFFATTLYLRIGLTKHDTFRDLLHKVNDEYRAALVHQDFGLLQLTMPVPGLLRSPSINWNQADPREPASEGAAGCPLVTQPFPFARAARDMDGEGPLSIYGGEPWLILNDTLEEIRGGVWYRSSHFSRNTMTSFAESLRLLATQFAENPRSCVAIVQNS
jgi:hypothetical protein